MTMPAILSLRNKVLFVASFYLKNNKNDNISEFCTSFFATLAAYL